MCIGFASQLRRGALVDSIGFSLATCDDADEMI